MRPIAGGLFEQPDIRLVTEGRSFVRHAVLLSSGTCYLLALLAMTASSPGLPVYKEKFVYKGTLAGPKVS
jgi:hypothetical protein